jgi:hypothetical protein
MENLRKICHYSGTCGLRERAIGIAKCAIELERYYAFGVGITIRSSSVLFIESEGSKILWSNCSRCKAEHAAQGNQDLRERLHDGDRKKN